MKAINVSMVADLVPPFEDRDWRHRWERLQAHEAELSKGRNQPLSGDAIQEARHELHSFYTQAYHLKDALKNDAASLGLDPNDVETAIDMMPALALAADLANLDKHVALNKRPRSGHIPKVVGASAATHSAEPGVWRLNLRIEHGPGEIDGITLATEIIERWREVLTRFGLI